MANPFIPWSVFFVLACSPPMLTLIPSTSNLSFPLQTRRNQDFFLSSTIEMNCNRLSHHHHPMDDQELFDFRLSQFISIESPR